MITKEQFIDLASICDAALTSHKALDEAYAREGVDRGDKTPDIKLILAIAEFLRAECDGDVPAHLDSAVDSWLWDRNGTVFQLPSGEEMDVQLPEDVWTFWEKTGTGPFKPA